MDDSLPARVQPVEGVRRALATWEWESPDGLKTPAQRGRAYRASTAGDRLER